MAAALYVGKTRCGPCARIAATRLLPAAAFACLLAGCASLVPQRPAEPPVLDIPMAWSSGDGVTPGHPNTQAWWRQFNDAQLTALIEQALNANTDVQGAVASLRQARALVSVQAATLSPQVDASASAQRSKAAGTSASNLFRAGFDASWEPDLFGANHAGLAAARADALASAASLGDVQISIAAEVASAYLQWCGTRVRLNVARQNLDTQQETLQIAQWRTQAGLSTSLEVEQARTAVEQTRAQIPALESTIAQAAHSIAVLTGRAPGELPQLKNSTALEAPSAPDGLALTIPADTLRQRPDVRRAEQQVRAAAARATQAEAQRYPSFSLSGNIGLSALTLAALGGSGGSTAGLLAAVSVPLFDGGALRAKVDAQDAALAGAGASYKGTVLGALQDVEDSLVSLRSAQERRVTLQRAAEAADNASLIARQRYRSGLIDFQTVLDTQRSQLSAQDGLVLARTDFAIAQVRLFKALGGGWAGADATIQAADKP
jgi:NodT family efflux transporter outer membrane factor (OMF) lipoprotein